VRIPRCYIDSPLKTGEQAILPEDVARHVRTVLRKGAGDQIILFNGSGIECLARIDQLDKKLIQATIESSSAPNVESSLQLHLAQGIAKGERMDWIIQKATELGVRTITPLFTERTVVKLSGARADKRREHWRQVAISAAEQCGRVVLPVIEQPTALGNWIKGFSERSGGGHQGIILHPKAEQSLRTLPLQAERPLVLLIGPEGGLSPAERDLASAHQFHMARMGPRVLRTETATLTALSLLQGQFGDLI